MKTQKRAEKEVLSIAEEHLQVLESEVKEQESPRRSSPKDQEIARRWCKEVWPVWSKEVGSDAATQTEERTWEVVEKPRRKITGLNPRSGRRAF